MKDESAEQVIKNIKKYYNSYVDKIPKKFLKNEKVIITIIQYCNIDSIMKIPQIEKYLNKENIAIEFVKHHAPLFQKLPMSIRENNNVIKTYIKAFSNDLYYGSNVWRHINLEIFNPIVYNDPEIMRKAILARPENLDFLGEKLKTNIPFIKSLLMKEPWLIKKMDDSIRDNDELGLYVVRKQGHMLSNLSPRLQADKKIVFAAAKNDIESLQYANKELLKDPMFAKELLKISIHSFKYFDDSIKKSKEFLLSTVSLYIGILPMIDKDVLDRKLVLIAASINPSILRDIDEKYLDDEKVILTIIKDFPWMIKYASERLKSDIDFMRKCYSINPKIVSDLAGLNIAKTYSIANSFETLQLIEQQREELRNMKRELEKMKNDLEDIKRSDRSEDIRDMKRDLEKMQWNIEEIKSATMR